MPECKKKAHLICNAHLDPVWLWQWEDGLTEALSTFRVACDFCDGVEGFVFCHNESLLYEWVEQHDPVLFKRIKRLVKAGRWHIAGGSYLQPDLNLPSGESHIRQFLIGKTWFRKAFGVEPTTAYNFDSFGQPEGYPQILAGCGFDSYIFCRPKTIKWKLPLGPFRWRGRSGSEIIAHRPDGHYLTRHDAHEKLTTCLAHFADESEIMVLWGIGNHGGGPSREDLEQIRKFAAEHPEYEFVHSTPEAYFRQAMKQRPTMPVVTGEFQNCFTGCYTSLSRVKRAHRACEGLMAVTERMAAMAWWLGRCAYPTGELGLAWKDILFGEFHDILAGACIPEVEKDSLALFGHCSHVLRQVKAKMFLRLLEGEKAVAEEITPIFLWNPHSFPISTDFECEFTFSNIMTDYGEADITLRDGHAGREIGFQREHPSSPLPLDFRVKVAVPLRLLPFQIRRIDASWTRHPRPKIWKAPRISKSRLTFKGKSVRIKINPRTGLVDFAAPSGARKSYLQPGALRATAWPDLDHSWECGNRSNKDSIIDPAGDSTPWRRPSGVFRLATRREAWDILSPPGKRDGKMRGRGIAPVRVVEYGAMRTIIETVFVMGLSAIIRHYVLSENQDWFEVRDRVFWNERDAMLKVAVPLNFEAANTISETPYSAVTRPVLKHHVEQVNQRWVAATAGPSTGAAGGRFVAVLNDCSHAHSITRDTLYISILRSPAYSSVGLRDNLDAHCLRYWPRQDQGEHEVRYRFMFGPEFCEQSVSRQAQVMNMAPPWIVHYPTRPDIRDFTRRPVVPFVGISARNVQVVALKKKECAAGLVVRLREQAGRKTSVKIKAQGAAGAVKAVVGAHELKTLVLKREAGRLLATETNLIEMHGAIKQAGPS